MADFSERELVERCRQGEETAFRELVDRYKAMVFALVSGAIADRSRVEDLAQEVFLRIHRGLPYFRGEARLSTWIFRIVVNLCAEQRARKTTEVSIDLADRERAAGRTDRLAAFDASFGDLELKDRLAKALQRLPPQDRLLLAAHYLEDVRYEDLAEALQMPLGTVKTRLHRAKRALRRILEAGHL